MKTRTTGNKFWTCLTAKAHTLHVRCAKTQPTEQLPNPQAATAGLYLKDVYIKGDPNQRGITGPIDTNGICIIFLNTTTTTTDYIEQKKKDTHQPFLARFLVHLFEIRLFESHDTHDRECYHFMSISPSATS